MRMRATEVLRRPVAMNSCVCAMLSSDSLGEFYRLGLLSQVRVRLAAINFEFAIDGASQAIMGNHSTDRALYQQLRVAGPTRPDILGFVTADKSRKTHETLEFFLLTAQSHFFGVDHDHEIAGIDVRGENRLLFSAQ